MAYQSFIDDFEDPNNCLIILLDRDHNYGYHSDSCPIFFETRIGVVVGYSHLA